MFCLAHVSHPRGGATIGGSCGVDGGDGIADPRVRSAQSGSGRVAIHFDSDVVDSSRLGPLRWLSTQCCCHCWPHLVGPRCGTTTFALLSIADPLAGFCNRGVLGGLDLDPAASITSFRIHTALRAGGQSAGGTPVGSPHVVGDGPSGGRLALAPPSFGGIVLARAATRGDVDFPGALD